MSSKRSYCTNSLEFQHRQVPEWWHGPEENYFKNGQSYIKKVIVKCEQSGYTASCKYSNVSPNVARKRALAKLTKKCFCGAYYHYSDQIN